MSSGEVTLVDVENRAFKVADKFSDNINLVVNEPSLALFRIQEHVRSTLPPLVERKCEMARLQKSIQGAVFGTEDAINAVKCMESSSVHFKNIQDLLKNAMFMRQQLKHKNMKKKEQSRLVSSIHQRNVLNTAEGSQNNNPPSDEHPMKNG